MNETIYKILSFTYCITVFLGITFTFVSLSTSPSFNQLNKQVKKLEKKPKLRNLIYTKRNIEKSFKSHKIDGLERLYLCQRLQPIEKIFQKEPETPGPKYAAGGPMDRIGPRT